MQCGYVSYFTILLNNYSFFFISFYINVLYNTRFYYLLLNIIILILLVNRLNEYFALIVKSVNKCNYY